MSLSWILSAGLLAVAVGAALAFVRIKEEVPAVPPQASVPVQADRLADYPSAPLARPLSLVFLHHSIGAHWLADPPGSASAGQAHSNGGGLRRALQSQGYRVHEATYGSKLGEKTDLFDWLPKLGGHLDEVLRVERQDATLPQGERNQIVMLKSCFPNSYLQGRGAEPGNPAGPELTLANTKATFRALLPIFARSPETLFVFVTTPPVAKGGFRERLGKVLVKRVLGRPLAAERAVEQLSLARELRDWLIAPDGWLASYAPKNVVVFDYYGVLTKHGASLFLEYPSGGGADSHPNSEGNQAATSELVPFLNRAARRMGIGDP